MSITSLVSRTMATPSKEYRKVVEGIFAINKPKLASSAGVLRDLQTHFAKSSLFQPWLDSQRRDMILSGAYKKHIDRLKVKLGHGGTLDPMATGVLIVGVGKGTKCLQRFLECTKTYECVVLFGAATDSYDAVGKVVGKAPYEHVTKELVEEKLEQFRGKIMQKPSVFSALKVDGKKMYEYAREGKNIPNVSARPVEVLEMELVEWLEPGAHEFTWPKEEADGAEREGAEKLLGIRKEDADTYTKRDSEKAGRKRSRTAEDDHVENAGAQLKRPKTDSEPAMSGALSTEGAATDNVQPPSEATDISSETPAPAEADPMETTDDAAQATTDATSHENSIAAAEQPILSKDKPAEIADETTQPATDSAFATIDNTPLPHPPAARIRMTVTSGFYVRSLCHDLGLACSSLGLMSSLIRSRQGTYTLSQNVLEFSDLEKGPETWEPQVQAQLEQFMEQEGWEAEEVEDEETWLEKKGEIMAKRKEEGRDRSFKGKEWKGKGGWGKNKGKGNRYSKDMNGGRRD
ncbi:pseudouridine synthase [Phaeosphaeriaceae sp. PMI808]|nr:pseudouridine synthase [Phaeosphaeriaceae sp. PMI808]